MSHEESSRSDRRTFLQAGALATAAAVSLTRGTSAQDAPAKPTPVPMRPLGKSGIPVTMLDQGTVRGPGFDRILRTSFENGIRMYDTSKIYTGMEAVFKAWFEQSPDVRKQIFLVDHDALKSPAQLPAVIDERLAATGTDYIDLFFIQSFGDTQTLDEATSLLQSKEFAAVVDKVKKSGKLKLFGISSHHKDRAPILEAAAKGGIVDAAMIQYRPWIEKDHPINKAIDSCAKAGIGLISMKQTAGLFRGENFKVLDEVVKRVPMLKEKNLTPYQGLLHAIWTDERIASVCTGMKNVEQIHENIDAARRFEPLKAAEIEQLRDAALAFGPTLCADCDGRCARAAGTTAELGDLTRFLTYHEHHGDRAEARRLYRELAPAARDWSGADLAAARAACPHGLDFARLLPEVDRLLG